MQQSDKITQTFGEEGLSFYCSFPTWLVVSLMTFKDKTRLVDNAADFKLK